MSIEPLITFKAGICEYDEFSATRTVKPQPRPGYVYLYSDDDLVHFCWRERNSSTDDPELDLVMVPTDGAFVPYTNEDQPTAKTNGRIFVLKFTSSSARSFFWLQSKSQARNGDPSWISPRDKKIGEIVHELLQGGQPNVARELAQVRNVDDRRDDDDGDETMEDIEGHGGRRESHAGGSGGAGHDATGGDIREEGENAREGGSDGGRAGATDADAAVRNFLQSLQGNSALGGSAQGGQGRQQADKPYPHLDHLLPNDTTIPMLRNATEDYVDSLLNFLPPTILVLATGSGELEDVEPSPDAVAAAKSSMNLVEKKNLLERVLRSPQFHQALSSLTMAIRDGGLPTIAEALNIKVANGGYMRGAGMPLGGGEAVEAFVEGVKTTVKEEEQE